MKNNIKTLRKMLNKTQEDFANEIGIKRTTLSGIESGKAKTKDATFDRICEKFNVNIEWLLSGTLPVFKNTNKMQEEFLNIFENSAQNVQKFLFEQAKNMLKNQK